MELEVVKNYLFNLVDFCFKDIMIGIVKQEFFELDKIIFKLIFFESYIVEDFVFYKIEQGMVMEVDDLFFI